MIELINGRINNASTREEKINKSREVLQHLILRILFERDAFRNISFVGGTALRILYDLRRFSEGIDFSLTDTREYNFGALMSQLRVDLERYGLKCEIRAREDKPIHSGLIRFPDLLNMLGIASQTGQKLMIKVEIDSKPPSGWNTELSLVQDILMFSVRHFDIPSLFATKLHACFFRKYHKGRDFYDLLWYLGRKARPNFLLLNNAIIQTHGKGQSIDELNFVSFLQDRLSAIDFNRIVKDVEPFLEDRLEAGLLNKDMLESLIRRNYGNGQ